MYPPLKKLSGHGKMIEPCGRLLHHERPFIREGNYLVFSVNEDSIQLGCVDLFYFKDNSYIYSK